MRGTLQRITINALQCPTCPMYVRSIMQLIVNFLINLNVVWSLIVVRNSLNDPWLSLEITIFQYFLLNGISLHFSANFLLTHFLSFQSDFHPLMIGIPTFLFFCKKNLDNIVKSHELSRHFTWYVCMCGRMLTPLPRTGVDCSNTLSPVWKQTSQSGLEDSRRS